METGEVEFSGAGVRSTGDWATATVDDLAADAAAAVAALQARPQVTPGTVGVLGHSEGGWVALRLCARRGTPRHLIINSCPAVSFAESEVYALTRAGAEQDTAAALIQQLTAAVRAGLGQLTTPTLAIFGGDDPLVPIHASIGRLRDTAERTARLQRHVRTTSQGLRDRSGPRVRPHSEENPGGGVGSGQRCS